MGIQVDVERVIIGTIIIAMLMQGGPTISFAQEEIDTSAQASILMDAESGRVLHQKNADQQMRIASITKIMTAIVALEHGDMEDMVETSEQAFGVEGSSIYLRVGESLSLEDMLYGLMLRSGNDAAVAIAEHIGGSIEGFVYLMNQKGAELGLTQTVFSNPHGLDTHEEHYSTAYEMAVITAYALQNEIFRTIVSTKRKTAPLEGEKWDRVWHNKNRMLTKYPYADGVKTGFTNRAKRTLVSSATKDDQQLVAVTLNGPDDWNDHIHMFEYGFTHYTQVTLVEEGQVLDDERYMRDDGYFQALTDFSYPLREDEHVRTRPQIFPHLSDEKLTRFPQPAGYIYYELEGQKIGKTPLGFVHEPVNRQSIWDYFRIQIEIILGIIHG